MHIRLAWCRCSRARRSSRFSTTLEHAYPAELRVFNRILDGALQQAVHRYTEARHRILDAVDRISVFAFGEDMSEDELLAALLRIMVETAPEVDEVTVLLKEGERLYVRQTVGLPREPHPAFSIPVGEGFSGSIAAHREPLFVRAADVDRVLTSSFLRECKLKAVYGVPLMDGSEVIGVAHMGSRTAYEFLEEDMLLFRALANRVSQILTETNLKRQLRQQHEELRLVLDHAKLGTFNQASERDVLKWDARTRELFGVAADERVTFERFTSLVAPEDRDRVEKAVGHAVDTGEDFQARYRVVRADGTERHLAVRGGVVAGAEGRPHLVGIVRDRTDEHEAELERELFLAALGHDLRSPLQAILIGIWSIVRTPGLPEQAMQTAQRVAGSGDRMKRLVEQLLDFARARAGKPVIVSRRRTDLVDLWHQVLAEIAVTAPGRRIDLEVTASTVGEWDPDRMLQLFQNLATNAVQYGDPSRPITIVLSNDGDDAVCEVHNEGEPIPGDVIPSLFNPFRRGRRDRHGLGLGLYIARQIVLGHEGQIAVRSSAEKGTTFRVPVPRRPRRS